MAAEAAAQEKKKSGKASGIGPETLRWRRGEGWTKREEEARSGRQSKLFCAGTTYKLDGWELVAPEAETPFRHAGSWVRSVVMLGIKESRLLRTPGSALA